MLRYGVLLFAAACTQASLYHIAADDVEDAADGVVRQTPQHWRDAEDDMHGRRHFLVRFQHKHVAGSVRPRKLLPQPPCSEVRDHVAEVSGVPTELVHVDMVPPDGHCVYADLSSLLRVTRWDVVYLREVRPRHKMPDVLWALGEGDGVRRGGVGGVAADATLIATVAEAVNFTRVVGSGLARVERVIVEGVPAVRYALVLKRGADVGGVARRVAAAPAVRWVEWAAQSRRASPLNYIAAYTVQNEGIDPPLDATGSERYHPLWERGIDGTGEVVLIGDSGLDHDSCYFYDEHQRVAVYPDVNLAHRKVISYVPDLINESGDTADQYSGHGTHVAGSLAGKSLHPGDEAARYNGLAHGAKIVMADFKAKGFELPWDLRTFYARGKALGALMTHNSWGGDSAPKEVEGTEYETDHFLWHNQDFAGVFAAGNNRNYGILKPASSKNGIGVGSHPNKDDPSQRDTISGFSAIGPTYDGRQKPDVIAPGGGVNSALADGSLDSMQCTLESKFGTSMAAPFVSASVLLLRQYLREGYYPGGVKAGAPAIGTPASHLLKALIVHSGVRMRGRGVKDRGDAVPESTQGFGRLSLPLVMYFNDGFRPGSAKDEGVPRWLWLRNNDTITHDEEKVYCFRAAPRVGGKHTHDGFKVSLVYADPPAAEGSRKAMVNDIDLMLQTPDGEVVYANAGRGLENNNNVEQIHVPTAREGVYRVYVVGHHVKETAPYAALPFSLVVTAENLKAYDESGNCPVSTVIAADNGGAPLPCPFDCSGHGECTPDGICLCQDGWFHVGCALCSDYHHCHGRGTCNAATIPPTCTCNMHVEGAQCEACSAGWYGPECDSNCRCDNGGTCDKATGVCTCKSSPENGFWTGVHCHRCARGYTGPECKTPSHWCENNARVTITDREGWIEVGSKVPYANGMTCKWVVQAPSTDDVIDFDFDHITIEEYFDFVKIFEGEGMQDQMLFSRAGHHAGLPPIRVHGGTALVVFISDHLGPDAGFKVRYTVVSNVPPTIAPPTALPTPEPTAAPPTQEPPLPTLAPLPPVPTGIPATRVPMQVMTRVPVPTEEPSPPTLQPTTAVPLTPAPPTPAPATAQPPTPAPATAIPPTPAPRTVAPVTPAPSTSKPVARTRIPAPATAQPPTPAPATGIPPTPTPRTVAPAPSTSEPVARTRIPAPVRTIAPTAEPTRATEEPATAVPTTSVPVVTVEPTEVPKPSELIATAAPTGADTATQQPAEGADAAPAADLALQRKQAIGVMALSVGVFAVVGAVVMCWKRRGGAGASGGATKEFERVTGEAEEEEETMDDADVAQLERHNEAGDFDDKDEEDRI